MANDLNGIESQANLRLRALKQLKGANGSPEERPNASAAFQVLYDLASSPSTATAALALLHELQVHQIELDLQDEEQRRARVELEGTLLRQVQLYDFAPVGCFTIDRDSTLRELNLTAARMLGSDRNSLLGWTLDSFLAPHSVRALQAMLARVNEGAPAAADALQLTAGSAAPRSVQASVGRDPDGRHFLVALVEAGGQG